MHDLAVHCVLHDMLRGHTLVPLAVEGGAAAAREGNGSGERWKGIGVSRAEWTGARGEQRSAELEPGTHSRKRDMNSEMCRSNVSVLEVRIAAKGVHVRSNVAIFGVQHRFRHSVEGVGKVHLASGATNRFR